MVPWVIFGVVFLNYFTVQIASQSLPCHTANGDNCPSVICPSTVVSYTCTVTSATAAGFTDWILPNGTCPTNSFPDKIRLSQLVNGQCSAQGSGGTSNMCGPYRASSIQSSDPIFCLSSILTVNITSPMNGTTVTCNNTSDRTLVTTVISSAAISLVGTPGSPNGVQLSTLCTDSLTVQWTPAAIGANATSYNVQIISTTTGTTVGAWTVAGDTTSTTIGDLIDGSNYTISVKAINCAGSSNSTSVRVQTLSCAPVGVNVTTVLYQNNSVHDVELFWTHRQNCSVPQYIVKVNTDMSEVNTSSCNTSSCSFVQIVSEGNISSYTVSVACSNRLKQTGQPYVTTQSVPALIVQVDAPNNVSGNTATVNCTFPNGTSYYCLVCCSSSPLVPAGSDEYISSTKGANISVSVSLQNLFSNQTYYCKAAATNTNSNCGGPVVGGVKTYFYINKLPVAVTTTSPPLISTPSISNGGDPSSAIVGGVVGGVGGGGVIIIVIIAVVAFLLKKKKKAGSKDRDDQMELEKSATMGSNMSGDQGNQNTGALYQDPRAIEHTQAPGGETYAVADKPVKATDKSKKPKGSKSKEDQKSKPGAQAQGDQNTGALYQDPNAIQRVQAPGGETYAAVDKPAKATDKSKKPNTADTSGSMYQDPKDIQHTTAGGEEYAVATKKPVGHTTAPTGDEYAVADTKQPKRK